MTHKTTRREAMLAGPASAVPLPIVGTEALAATATRKAQTD